MLGRFPMQGKGPQCVIVMHVETVYFQRGRAIQRSQLWQALAAERNPALPGAGRILSALTDGSFDGETDDRALPARHRDTLR